mgnify:CR=1 FL=1
MYKLKSFTNVDSAVAISELCFDHLSGALAHVAMLVEAAEHDMNADLAPEFMRHEITRGYGKPVLKHTVKFFCSYEG